MLSKTIIQQVIVNIDTKVSNLYGDSEILVPGISYNAYNTRVNTGMPIIFGDKDLQWHYQTQNNIPFVIDPDGQIAIYHHLISHQELVIYFTGMKLIVLDGREPFFKRMELRNCSIFGKTMILKQK
jgi:hypothetical protein